VVQAMLGSQHSKGLGCSGAGREGPSPLGGQKKSCRKSRKMPGNYVKPRMEVSCTPATREAWLLCRRNAPGFSITERSPQQRFAVQKEQGKIPARNKLHEQVQQFGLCQPCQSYSKGPCFPTLPPSTRACPPTLRLRTSRQLSKG